jgi:hypothetical protein
MPFLELKPGQLLNDSVKILDYKEGGLGRIYFGYCQKRQIKVVIKTIRREIWEQYKLADKWASIKNDLITGTLPLHTIDLGEYLFHIFFREARLICQAQHHPNVLRGTNLWWTEAGQPFFECENLWLTAKI